jgi:hypothetical protein
MYIATLSTDIPPRALPAGLDELRALWLDGYLASGDIVAAGPTAGATAHVVICGGLPRTQLDAMLAGDPWVCRGLGRYTTMEIPAARLGDALQTPASGGPHL